MAIVPQGNSATNQSVNSSDVFEGLDYPHIHIHTEQPESNYDILYQYEASIINTLLSIDPENCADGSCPPVEIPIIFRINDVSYSYHTELANGTPVVNQQTLAIYDNVYNDFAEVVNTLNKILSGQHSEINGGYQFAMSAIRQDDGPVYPTETDGFGSTASGAPSPHSSSRRIHFADIGFYTGSQVFDDETGEFVDEFIPYSTVRELYPNIQFVLPTKIKTEHFLKGLFPGNISLNVDINTLYNDVFNEELPPVLRSEYLYFDDNTPGYIKLPLDRFTSQFYTNSNFIARTLNPNAVVTSPGSSTNYGITYPGLGEDYFFKHIAYVYGTNFTLRNTEKMGASGGPYEDKGVSGPVYPAYGLNPTTLLHEFAHAFLPGGHSWFASTLSGIHAQGLVSVSATNRFPSAGIVFPLLYSPSNQPDHIESMHVSTDYGDLYNTNVIADGNLLKPPFSYTAKNPDYDRIKRAHDIAVADLDDFNDKVANGEFSTVYPSGYVEPVDFSDFYPGGESNGVTLNAVRNNLISRKNDAILRLQDTPETISGDFLTIDEEEKEYVEFYLKRYIPSVTNNFTNRVQFISGASDGSTAARIEQPFYRNNTDFHRALQPFYGLQSFWGGSYVLNNPPAVDSTYVDPETGLEVGVYAVKEQRYCSVFKALSGVSAREIPGVLSGNPSWRLTDINELEILLELPSALSFLGNFSTPWVDLGDSVGRYSRGSKTVKEPIIGYEDLSNYPGNFGDIVFLVKDIDLLEDDTISTSFVVNPTNDDGTRKGPDVTSYVPFCVPTSNANGDPVASDVYDPTWLVNFNAYNDNYPAYPANTKVTDLLNEEYCPCLYKSQSYYDGSSTAYTYQLIDNPTANPPTFSNLDALKRLHKNSTTNVNNGSGIGYYRYRRSGSTSLVRSGSFMNLKYFYDYIERKFNSDYQIPPTFNTIQDVNDLPNPILYRYSDPNTSYLELPPATGYYGIGPFTILPIVYQYDIKELTSLLVNKQDFYEQHKEGVPSEYYLMQAIAPMGNLYGSELRYGRRYGGEAGFSTSNAVELYVGAVETRYDIGDEDVNSDLYNPLRKYAGNIYYTTGLTAGETYHRDFTGDYNPINISHVLQYNSSLVLNKLPFTKDEVRRLNYNFNDDLRQNLVYRSIAEEAQAPDTSLTRTIDVGSIVTLNHESYYVYRKDPGVTVPVGEYTGQVKNRLVAINLSRAYRRDLGHIYNYTDPFNNSNYPQGHDYVSYYTSIEDRNAAGVTSLYSFLTVQSKTEISQALIDSGFFTGNGPDLGVKNVGTGEPRRLLLRVEEASVPASKNNIYIRYAEYDENTGTVEVKQSTIFSDSGYSDPLRTEALGTAVFSEPWVSEYLTNSTEFASGYSQLLIREFYATDEELILNQEKRYLVDAFTTVAEKILTYDSEGQLGGCTDPTKFNFNPEATYNDFSCIDIVEGCTQSWADNYNSNANTDDGSCQATICLDTDATGEWGFGYNAELISSIQAYNPDAIIPAESASVLQLDLSSGSTSCQYLVQRRASIMKVVCLNYQNTLEHTCNQNEDIQVIRVDSGSISQYGNNPVVEAIPLQELVQQVYVIGITNSLLVPSNSAVQVFNQSLLEGSIEHDFLDDSITVSSGPALLQRNLIKDRLLLQEQVTTTTGSKVFVYNCPENPILPDGSGGCMLVTLEGQNLSLEDQILGCTFPELETKTPEDCFNETIFEGGYILDASIFSEDAIGPVNGICDQTASKYIVPGSMNQTSPILNLVTKDLLPLYSSYQVNNPGITGYSPEVLMPELTPGNIREASENSGVSEVSSVLQIINPNFLYTEDGESYTGPYVYIVQNGEKRYYIHSPEDNGLTASERLYFRNQLLEQGITNSEEEVAANNFNEIVNEINNLTIFTDN